jgi:hypothetical protein
MRLIARTDLVVPETWLKLLKRFDAVGLDVCIAGGALRDLDNGKPIKDLDVWVFGGTDLETVISKINLALEKISTWLETSCGYQSPPNRFSDRLYTVMLYCGFKDLDFPVNVIVCSMRGVAETIATFDFGITQIGCDASGFVGASSAYIKDKRNKTFTYIKGSGDIDRSWWRWEKISERAYPDWRVVGLTEPKGDWPIELDFS